MFATLKLRLCRKHFAQIIDEVSLLFPGIEAIGGEVAGPHSRQQRQRTARDQSCL